MASLVQRAFLARDGQWRGNDEVAVSSRRLQVRDLGTVSKEGFFRRYFFPNAPRFQLCLFTCIPHVLFPKCTVLKFPVLLNTRYYVRFFHL